MAVRCKFCGGLYGGTGNSTGIQTQSLLKMIFLGRRVWNRDKYCCEGHYDIHTERKWADDRIAGLKRFPMRVLKIVVVLGIITIGVKINEWVNGSKHQEKHTIAAPVAIDTSKK